MTDAARMTWGHDRHELVSVEQAWESIAGAVEPGETFSIPIDEAAGHVLAEPIVAGDDSPSFDKAMMDGFAVRSADCGSPGAELRIIGLAAAGSRSGDVVQPGQAMRINTGAPVPAGADAVVMVEQTTAAADGATVRIETEVEPNRNIVPRGGIRRAGETVLTPPARLGPIQIAAAAGAGVASLAVYRRPGVAIVLTGDELVPAGQPRKPGQIHESNGLMLAALLTQFGARPRPPVIAGDTPDALSAAFTEALREPVVLAVGGMSMGTLDLVPRAFETIGVQWRWHGVAMRPGKPAAYGRGPGGQHVFGLPGNPMSAFVCAWLFVRMVIDGLQGLPVVPPPRWAGALTVDLAPARDARPAFVPAKAWLDDDRHLLVEPCPWRGSSDPFGAAAANALLMREQPTRPIRAGGIVPLIPIGPIG